MIYVPDVLADPEYTWSGAQKIGGYRAAFAVPLLRQGEVVGVLFIAKTVPQPFTAKQIELATTFADQAVIAIENTRLLNELRELLQQQTATADVLKVISRSTFDLQTVLDTLVKSAVQLCDADMGQIARPNEAGFFQTQAHFGHSTEIQEELDRIPFQPGRDSLTGRVLLERATVQIVDAQTDPEYKLGKVQRLGGFHSMIGTPLLREGTPIGVFGLARHSVRPFTDKQMALLTTFADQAVIAIENARLFDEVRARTDELSEALRQQTATADVLGKVLEVISGSAFDLQPVFDTVAESSVKLCEAERALIWRYDGKLLRMVAAFNSPPEFKEWCAQHPILPGRHTAAARAALERRTIHIPDVQADPEYTFGAKDVEPLRTVLAVPILKGDDLLGVIVIYRFEVRPFTDKQVALVEIFADQSAIAIENVRLFEEVQQRTRDLSESLEQQTAAAEVLMVISGSRGELEPVFDAILENAVQICGAEFGCLELFEGNNYRRAASHNAPTAFFEARARDPVRPLATSHILSRVATTKQVIQVTDLLAEQPEEAIVRLGGARTILCVPMLKDNRVVGVISIFRQEVRPFTQKQTDLVTNFSTQAVIAIENTRLLNELRESLQQQTATADVLKVISRSAFDLPTVLRTLVESAARLCEADKANIVRQRGDSLYLTEACGYSQEFIEAVEDMPIEPTSGLASGRALLEGRIVHIPDVEADPEYTFTAKRLGDYRTILAVPMLREGEAIGVLILTRSDVRPFTDKQIETASTFADQAAIAIENVRLFDSVEARTRELAKSLEDLRAAQDRLVQTEKLASLGQLTAGIAHEIKNPLNFVNNFSSLGIELISELEEALKAPRFDDKVKSQITELADMLKGNLDKVVEHGKRADLIVKNMLLHSRQESGEHRPVDINALVAESLNLAYHGARAAKQGFNITLEQSLDPAAGKVDVFPQEITRVLLNLISNGFYAATKRKAEANSGDYEPTLTATTKDLGDSVEIRIRDNGTGIPAEVRDKLFNPFFTTKPPGEGTGLGLSLSYDVIVKQHGGSIEVDTQPGEFTEFTIVLPRSVASVDQPGEHR